MGPSSTGPSTQAQVGSHGLGEWSQLLSQQSAAWEWAWEAAQRKRRQRSGCQLIFIVCSGGGKDLSRLVVEAPAFTSHSKNWPNHSISSLLCAWQTFMFGTGGGGWQQQHRDHHWSLPVWLLSHSQLIWVLKSQRCILSLRAWIPPAVLGSAHPVLAGVASTATRHILIQQLSVLDSLF